MTTKAHPAGQPAPVTVAKKRILVVDDHPAIRLGVRAFLEAEVDLCEPPSVSGWCTTSD